MTTENALAEISTNVTVGMDEVVSVFISQYETNLFDQKAELGNKVKGYKADIKAIDLALISAINKEDYESAVDLPGIQITTLVNDITVYWPSEHPNSYGSKIPSVKVQVQVQDDTCTNQHNGNQFSRTLNLPISQVSIDDRDRMKADLAETTEQLQETLLLIKSVSRKERQVRGEISKRKLETSGMSELLSDSTMQDLIRLN